MFLNLTKNEIEKDITKEIEVGNTLVKRSDSTKLLGIEIDAQQNWKEHFNTLVNEEIMKITQSIWIVKVKVWVTTMQSS